MTMFLAPYTAIADIDGSPLDAGFLFFGEYGKDPESYPIAVYWDADFTVPAAQPIRTRNGYPMRNGSPCKIYLKQTEHSLVIKNKNLSAILVEMNNKGISSSMLVRPNGQSVETSLSNIYSDLSAKQQQINEKPSQQYLDKQLSTKAPQATTYTKIEVDSALSLKAPQSNTYTKAEVDTTFAAYVGGRKAYTTLALAQADQVNLPANTSIEVTNDGANNGTYQWNGTTLTKSAYDPLTQAKNHTNALTGGATPNAFSTCKLTLDFVNNQATLTSGIVAYGSNYLEVSTSQTVVLIPSTEVYPKGVRKICVHNTSKEFRIFNTLDSVDANYILLGYLWLNKWYSTVDGLFPVVVGDALNTFDYIYDLKYASDGEVIAGGIIINKAAKTVSTDGVVIVWSPTFRNFVPSTSIKYDGDLIAIVVESNTGELKVLSGSDTLSPSHIVIAKTVGGYLHTSSINEAFNQEGADKFVIYGKVTQNQLASELGFLSPELRLTIDFSVGEIQITQAGYVFARGTYFPVVVQTIPFNNTDPTYMRSLSYSLYPTEIQFKQSRPQQRGAYETVFGYVYNYQFFGLEDSKNQVTIINKKGQVVEPSGGSDSSFNELTQRALMPNKLFFIEDRGLPIYKDSVFSNPKSGLDKVRTWIDTNHAETIKRYIPVLQQTILNPQDLSNSIQFVYAHESVADKRYWKNIAVSKAPQSKLNRSFNMLCFGDSLTQVGTPWTLKNKLESLGATVTPVGTFWSTESPNELPSEGRGWWNYREFIGKDNASGGVVHTRSEGGKTRTAKFENPFLKLATAQDKTDHPNWCFRFTGAQKELSYADDTDKSGNFYIFDFDWYLTQHSVANPDFITIGLSTNDINLDRDVYSRSEVMQYMQLGLEVMVKQIHKVLPNVPIGIIPCPAWSATVNGYATFASDTATWAELCFKKVAELKATHSNLEIVPVHLHMNRDMGYPVVNNVNLSADSDVQVGVISDWVHYDQVGRDQYADVVAAWLANSI